MKDNSPEGAKAIARGIAPGEEKAETSPEGAKASRGVESIR